MPPSKKHPSDDEAVRREYPDFDVVQRPKPDARFLPPDSKTPAVKELHRKYSSDSPEESVVESAPSPSSATATHAVVVEPKKKQDAAAKRLTVLVKQGKVGAVQG